MCYLGDLQRYIQNIFLLWSLIFEFLTSKKNTSHTHRPYLLPSLTQRMSYYPFFFFFIYCHITNSVWLIIAYVWPYIVTYSYGNKKIPQPCIYFCRYVDSLNNFKISSLSSVSREGSLCRTVQRRASIVKIRSSTI